MRHLYEERSDAPPILRPITLERMIKKQRALLIHTPSNTQTIMASQDFPYRKSTLRIQ